jgi:hypothetical protein
MAMEAEQFGECLLLYGADLQRWPEAVRQAGLEALEGSLACRALKEDHLQFEAILRTRELEAPSPDLETRIIAAASRRERMASPGLAELLRSCFADLRLPAPVLTTAAVLIVGVVIGLWLPTQPVLADSESAEVQAFLDSPTEAL